MENGEVYGACFLFVKERNAGKHLSFRVQDCRKHCRELGADLPVTRSGKVFEYLLHAATTAGFANYHFWMGATYSQEAGDWVWLPDGSNVSFTAWAKGEPNGPSINNCGENCLVTNMPLKKWADVGCGLRNRRCACHIENATRDGAVVYREKEKTTPFSHNPEALALVIITMVVVGIAYCCAAYGKPVSGQVAVAAGGGLSANKSGEMAVTIENEEEEEQKKFKARLDGKAYFPRFQAKEDEQLFAKTVCDAGMGDIRTFLTQALPFIMLAAAAAMLAITEGYNSIPGLGSRQGLSEKEFGGRPLIIAAMSTTLFSFCVGFVTTKRSVSVALFPYFAFGSAVLFLVSYFLSISVMVRYGSLWNTTPWDGQARMLLAMAIIFIPRMMHLPLSFATLLNIVGVLSLELSLNFMYALYKYECGCYQLALHNMSTVRFEHFQNVHSIPHFTLTHLLYGSMNIQPQIGTNAVIWAIVLYLIYKVQLANELESRKSFLRLLDKNRELMKAEKDKRALEDDVRKLEADNERIRKEVAVSGMNDMQVQLVQVRSAVRCMSTFSNSS